MAFIPDALLAQLARVDPSADRSLEYRACRVKLETRAWQDHVNVVEAHAFLALWNVWPWQDPARQEVLIDRVEAIEASPSRLAPDLATQAYGAGESGMGYPTFTLVTADGRRLACIIGNAVDWIGVPSGFDPSDTVGVLAHVGREAVERGEGARGSSYAWCLYRLGDAA